MMLSPRRLAVLREFAGRGTIAAAAEALAARADELLTRLEEIEVELAAQAADVRGTVRVAAFQTAAQALAVPALERLASAHPRVRVELSEVEAEESLPLLARGGLDVAIAEEYEHAPRPRLPRLHRVELEPDELLLALPRDHPAAAGGGPVALAALRDADWASGRTGTGYADMVAGICRSAGFEPDVPHRLSDLRLLLDLVAAGWAVALVPALGRPERDARVAIRRMAEGHYSRALFAAVRASDRARPATVAVVDALRRAAAG